MYYVRLCRTMSKINLRFELPSRFVVNCDCFHAQSAVALAGDGATEVSMIDYRDFAYLSSATADAASITKLEYSITSATRFALLWLNVEKVNVSLLVVSTV